MPTTLDPSTWRRTTNGGIPYKLMEGYPKINGSGDKVTAQEKYIIRSSDVNAFFIESIPAPVIILGTVTWPDRRRLPGAPILITKSLSFEPFNSTIPFDPFDADSGAPDGTYDPFCAVQIDYETLQNESDQEQDPNDPETFLTHTVSATGEHLLIAPNNSTIQPGLEAGDDSTGGQEPIKSRTPPIVKTIPTIEHGLKWKNVLAPKWDRIISYLGKINDRIYVFSGAGSDSELAAAKHCLMFRGVSGSQSYIWDGASAGVQPWSLDFKFEQREIDDGGKTYGWNHVFMPDRGDWVQLRRANGELLYEDVDIKKLFTA